MILYGRRHVPLGCALGIVTGMPDIAMGKNHVRQLITPTTVLSNQLRTVRVHIQVVLASCALL